jgi:hypothetical protein
VDGGAGPGRAADRALGAASRPTGQVNPTGTGVGCGLGLQLLHVPAGHLVLEHVHGSSFT